MCGSGKIFVFLACILFLFIFLSLTGAGSSETSSGNAEELTSFLVDKIPNTNLILDKSSIKTETIGEIPKEVIEKKPEIKGTVAVVNAKYGTGNDARSVTIVKYKTVKDAEDAYNNKVEPYLPESNSAKKSSIVLKETGSGSLNFIIQYTWVGEDFTGTKYGDTSYQGMHLEKNYHILYGSPWGQGKGSKEEALNTFKAISENILKLLENPSAQATISKDLSVESGAIEEKYKTFLDANISLLATINTRSGSYKIVEYKNIIPIASGVEIFSLDGRRVEDSSKAYPILTSLAWMEAANKLKPEDLETLQGILQTSQQIDSAVSPVFTITSTATSSIDSLKEACIPVPFVGKKCAWDAVTASYPGINEFANQLESFNNELSEWKNAASSVGEHLPNVISGLKQAKSGGDISQLQSEISQSLSSFGALQKKTSQMSEKLASISSSLSNAENGLRSAANTPFVGALISPVANTIESMGRQVDSLKGKADSFSSTMSEQSQKLSTITTYANDRESELQSMWNARQNASIRVYGTIISIIILILIIFGFIQYNKRLKAQGKTFQFPQFGKKTQTTSPNGTTTTMHETPYRVEVKKSSPDSMENKISSTPQRLKVKSSKKSELREPQRLKVKSSKTNGKKL